MKKIALLLIVLYTNLAYASPSADEIWDIGGYGNAHVYYGNDTVLDRPIIIVQPFELFTDINENTFYDSMNNSSNGYMLNDLRSQGRDIILFMFSNPTASMIYNGEGLIKLINKTNSKISYAKPLVLAGVSMGGVITRYALTKMESTQQEHNTALYLSYDAPHHGAIVPEDIPARLRNFRNDLQDFVGFCEIVIMVNCPRNYVEDYLNILNSDAARELIVKTPQDPKRTSFLSTLSAYGGFPKTPYTYAFSNGSNSTYQGIGGSGPNGVGAKVKAIEWHFDKGILSDGNYKVYANKTRISRVCRYDLGYRDTIECNDKLEARQYTQIPQSWLIITEYAGVDNRPGAHANLYGVLKYQLDAFVQGGVTSRLSISNTTPPAQHAFVLTESALAKTGASLFDGYETAGTINEEHALLTYSNATQIKNLINTYQYGEGSGNPGGSGTPPGGGTCKGPICEEER